MRVKLSEIIEALQFQSYEAMAFLNKNTGEIILVSPEEQAALDNDEAIEDLPEWQQEAFKALRQSLAESRNCIPLPSKFDIDEYGIIEEFCLSLEDGQMRETLYALINGRGAFRRFKDAVHEYGIADRWYEYQLRALTNFAIEWCQENGIDFYEK
jgi:hypothetical protein